MSRANRLVCVFAAYGWLGLGVAEAIHGHYDKAGIDLALGAIFGLLLSIAVKLDEWIEQ